MIGVNISGGEYKESGLAYGRDYIFPSNAEIDYYAGKGMDVIRVPFQWERLQKTENGALNGEEVARLKAVVAYANTKGLTVILDAHDYGTRTIGGTSYKLGVDDKAPASLLADFWGRMATEFKGSDVFYGIMNEPHYQTAAQWAPVANAAIKAIREAGASEKILVPGTNWTGAHNWVSGQNDTEIGAKVVDPLDNFAFEVHQYLDSDSSGTHASVVSETIGVQRLTAITAWAKATGNQLFLGEFGVASDATSLKAMDNMLKYMDDHADVWLGGTYWAGGAWWGNYMYSIEPTDLKTKGVNATDRAQMDILEKYDIDPGTMPTPTPTPTPTPEPTPTPTPTPTPPSTVITTTGLKIDGTAANDTIQANNLGNKIYAKGGNDIVKGGAGNDFLDGGAGADVLFGGGGNDTFYFSSANDAKGDVILDFVHGHDRIDLSKVDAVAGGTTNEMFSFIGTQGFTKAGQLHITQDTAKGVTYVEGNLDANLSAEFRIEVKGLHTFASGDFIL